MRVADTYDLSQPISLGRLALLRNTRYMGQEPDPLPKEPPESGTHLALIFAVDTAYQLAAEAFSTASDGNVARARKLLNDPQRGARAWSAQALKEIGYLKERNLITPAEAETLRKEIVEGLNASIAMADEAIEKSGSIFYKLWGGFKRRFFDVAAKTVDYSGEKWNNIVFLYKTIVKIETDHKKALADLKAIGIFPETEAEYATLVVDGKEMEKIRLKFEQEFLKTGLPLEVLQTEIDVASVLKELREAEVQMRGLGEFGRLFPILKVLGIKVIKVGAKSATLAFILTAIATVLHAFISMGKHAFSFFIAIVGADWLKMRMGTHNLDVELEFRRQKAAEEVARIRGLTVEEVNKEIAEGKIPSGVIKDLLEDAEKVAAQKKKIDEQVKKLDQSVADVAARLPDLFTEEQIEQIKRERAARLGIGKDKDKKDIVGPKDWAPILIAIGAGLLLAIVIVRARKRREAGARFVSPEEEKL